MRALLLLSGLLIVSSCTSSANHEDTTYEMAKTQAKRDLGCSDVQVKKMSQLEEAFEYQAEGCDDIFTYGIDCADGCQVVAGVRGKGLGAVWNTVSGADGAAHWMVNEFKTEWDRVKQHQDDARQRQAEMRKRYDEMSERHDEMWKRVDEMLEAERDPFRGLRPESGPSVRQ